MSVTDWPICAQFFLKCRKNWVFLGKSEPSEFSSKLSFSADISIMNGGLDVNEILDSSTDDAENNDSEWEDNWIDTH